MNLEKFGWNAELESQLQSIEPGNLIPARVVAVFRERYVLRTIEAELDAEITGNLRFSAKSSNDFPAVGDWVAIMIYDHNQAIIHKVLPRKSKIERQAVGKKSDKQLIAANVDCSFIMQSVDGNFNINRLERYISISRASNILPITLLSKIDLISQKELTVKINSISKRQPGLKIIPFSNMTLKGHDAIIEALEATKTYCFIGSSGVGKSTLINHLIGKGKMATRSVSSSTGKGKHTTSHKELFILKNGSIVIDTPGMREVGVTESSEDSFDIIRDLTNNCKYTDCTHIHEDGCAILEALEDGRIDQAGYDNFMKLQREAAHFQASVAEKRKKDKVFGKMAKEIMKHKKRNKF